MSQRYPRLFISLATDQHRKALDSMEVIKKFTLCYGNDHFDWVNELSFANAELAIIEANEMPKTCFEALQAGNLISDIDFIFISDGKPNPYLDKLMQKGAGFHFRAPVDYKLLEDALIDSHEEICASEQNKQRVVSSDLDQFGMLVGSSRAMHKLYRTIRKVANSDANVLVIGESGSGKELVANTVHQVSPRADKPFVAINCGALSPELVDSELFGHMKGSFTGAVRDHKGVFEQAEGGTLFLDEVTEMPKEHQVKLLRVLENGEYLAVGSSRTQIANVRIVAATNRDPAEAIAEDVFREDLYFRLAQFPLTVPPLRDRGGDIVGLAKHFLAYRNAKDGAVKGITEEALKLVAAYNWPGNVRELKHTIERAFILADEAIGTEHVMLDDVSPGASDPQSVPTDLSLEELERMAILKVLEENQGNKTESAEQLGISVKTLYNKLEKYQKEGVI